MKFDDDVSNRSLPPVVGPRTIIFLGAGASAPFGYPTMPELTSKLKRLIDGQERDLLYDLIPSVLSLKGSAAMSAQDIEGALQTIDLVDVFPNTVLRPRWRSQW